METISAVFALFKNVSASFVGANKTPLASSTYIDQESHSFSIDYGVCVDVLPLETGYEFWFDSLQSGRFPLSVESMGKHFLECHKKVMDGEIVFVKFHKDNNSVYVAGVYTKSKIQSVVGTENYKYLDRMFDNALDMIRINIKCVDEIKEEIESIKTTGNFKRYVQISNLGLVEAKMVELDAKHEEFIEMEMYDEAEKVEEEMVNIEDFGFYEYCVYESDPVLVQEKLEELEKRCKSLCTPMINYISK